MSTHSCQEVIEMQYPPPSPSSQDKKYIPVILYNHISNRRPPIMFSRDSFFAACVPSLFTDMPATLVPPYFVPERAGWPLVSRACGRTTAARCHPLLVPFLALATISSGRCGFSASNSWATPASGASWRHPCTVSYTHLTLPTICSV